MLIDYSYLASSLWFRMLSQKKYILEVSVTSQNGYFSILKNHFSVRLNSSLKDYVESSIMLDNTD